MEREPRLVKAGRGESGGACALWEKTHQRKGVSTNYFCYCFMTKSGKLRPQVMFHNTETMKNKLEQLQFITLLSLQRWGGLKHNYASFQFHILKANIVI